LLIFSLLVSGCSQGIKSAALPGQDMTAGATGSETPGWWVAYFTVDWPEDTQPRFYIDTLLAHRLVEPELNRFHAAISLWRIHRRAARDEAGHRFRFIFYAPVRVAAAIFRDLQSHPLLADLQHAGVVKELVVDDVHGALKTDIGDTGDKTWSPDLYESWPYFAMGASQTWLSLVDRYASNTDAARSVPELLQEYERVDQRVTDTWQAEGGHAFLHHLNAIFGYQPIGIQF
jgi:hypothetical protein